MATEHVCTPASAIVKQLHVSHLHHYVSAYESSPAKVRELICELVAAQKRAHEYHSSQVVDQDGEMFFLVHYNGTFDLCLRWKHFEFADEVDA